MSTAAKTNRRWLKSAITAAASEDVMLPWAAKRIKRVATSQSSNVIRIFASAPSKYTAIAAR